MAESPKPTRENLFAAQGRNGRAINLCTACKFVTMSATERSSRARVSHVWAAPNELARNDLNPVSPSLGYGSMGLAN